MNRSVIKKKIEELKKRRKKAVDGEYFMGSNHPEYTANASKYDYAVEVLQELLDEPSPVKAGKK